MKKLWMISLMSLLFVLTGCQSDEDKVKESVVAFYTNVYTGKFHEAGIYCTPESQSVISFFENTYKADTALLAKMSEFKIDVKVSQVKITNDKEASVTVTVHGLPVFTNKVGNDFFISEEPSVYEVKLYKVEGRWLVTADLYGLL